MALRWPASMRLLARRRALLLVIAGVAAALTFATLLALAVVAGIAALAPPDWPVVPVGLALALLGLLPLHALALAFVRASTRAYTVAVAGGLPRDPVSAAGGLLGLGLFTLGRRVRHRRGFLPWITDPWGAAAGMALRRVLPPEHPLSGVLEAAGLEPRRPPTRGAGLLALAIWLLGLAAALVAASMGPPGLGWALGMLLVPAATVLAVLVAAMRGAVQGAWDRYLMDRMASEAHDAAERVAGAVGRGAGPGPVY